jgi:hypothetical protein
MSLRLKEISFNHDSSCATVDAFNIRKNECEFIEPPEWRRGLSSKPEDSPAAYARFETQTNTLTIKANFSFDGTEDREIRALDANLHREALNGPDLSQAEVDLFEKMEVKDEGNVLGEVQAKTFKLNSGETDQLFDLGSVRIWDAGVGMDDIVWRWQFRVSGTENWIDFAITTHHIYTVLRVPKRPWSQVQNMSNTQLPWTEVLDCACEWAKAARNPDDAAEKIARQVNGLGRIYFDNCNYGSSHYSDGNNFDCTALLSRIRGETGHGPRVNCSDCAAVVSTFANSIGCDLEQSVMEPRKGLRFFPLQEHLRIGLAGRMTGGFIYHELAWEGQGRDQDEVFDACVQVDGDDEPGTFSPFVPTNLPFGAVGQRGYRFRLVPRGSEETCRSRPDLAIRRRVGPVSSPRALPAALNLFKRIYDYDSWKRTKGPGTRHFILDYFFGDFALPGWQVIELRHSGSRGKRPFIQSFWKPTQGRDEAVLRIDVCVSFIWTDAREVLLTFLTKFQLPGIELREQHFELGDIALSGPEPCAILFANANLALLVRNVGKDVFPVTDIATAMTEKLLHPPLIPIASRSSLEIAKRFRFEGAETSFGQSMRIIEDPPGSSPGQFYQFVSQLGEVSLRDEKLFYRPLQPGQHTLEIFAINSVGAVPAEPLSLTVRSV